MHSYVADLQILQRQRWECVSPNITLKVKFHSRRCIHLLAVIIEMIG